MGIKKGDKMRKIKPKFGVGIFVGVNRRSGEIFIVNKEGLHESRTVKRLPLEERWGRDNTEWVLWVPWHRYHGAEDRDGDVPEGVEVEERENGDKNAGDQKKGEPVIINTRLMPPREFHI